MVPPLLIASSVLGVRKMSHQKGEEAVGEGKGGQSHVQLTATSWVSEGNTLFVFVSETEAFAKHLRFFKKQGARVNHFWRPLMFTSLSVDKRA